MGTATSSWEVCRALLRPLPLCRYGMYVSACIYCSSSVRNYITLHNSLTHSSSPLPAANRVRECLLNHPAFAGQAEGPGKGLLTVLTDPASGCQQRQGSGYGAAPGSDTWPFVVIAGKGGAVHTIGLSARWLWRVAAATAAATANGRDDINIGAAPARTPVASTAAAAGFSTKSERCATSGPAAVLPSPPGAWVDSSSPSLPLGTLLAAVGRLLPLPRLPSPPSPSSAAAADESFRESLVTHLAATAILEAIAAAAADEGGEGG